MVDAANSNYFLSSGGAYYFYPKRGSSAVYLCPILEMMKILKIIKKIIKVALNFLSVVILSAAYFILLFPFAIFVKICTDFLEVRQRPPFWIPHKQIENTKEFLVQQ